MIFTKLQKLRAFEKEHLPFLVTLEDFDIVHLIGLHQERGEPLSLKHLYVEGIGSVQTLTRRLRKLRNDGIVIATQNGTDRRAINLELAPHVHKAYSRYEKLLNSA